MWLFPTQKLLRRFLWGSIYLWRVSFANFAMFSSLYLSTNHCHTHSGIFPSLHLPFSASKEFFSKYFSLFPPQVFFSSNKIYSLLQIFSALSFFAFLNQFYRSIYLLIEIKIAEGGRADLFLAKSLPSGSSTYTAGQLTHFGEGEKCFHKSLTCTFNHSLHSYKYYNEILLKHPGNHNF